MAMTKIKAGEGLRNLLEESSRVLRHDCEVSCKGVSSKSWNEKQKEKKSHVEVIKS